MSTKATLLHHLQAIGEGIDSVMHDYREDSVLFTQQGPLIGLAAIRGFFEQFINGAPPSCSRRCACTARMWPARSPTSSGVPSRSSSSQQTPLSCAMGGSSPRAS